MKIALIRTDFRGYTHRPDMPSGMLYVAAWLEKHGYEVDVFDFNYQPLVDLSQYDLVAFSMLPLARKQAWNMIKELKAKKPKIKIVLGGVFPSSIPEFLIKNLDIDAIVVGEGEQTFLELVRFWEDFGLDKNPVERIQGLCTKEFGLHEKREQIKDLDDLPFPSWKHIGFDWYQMTYAQNNPALVVNGVNLAKEKLAGITASRGCPNLVKPCYFCQTPIFWQKKYRFRSGQHVFNEIKELYYTHGVKTFTFNDDAFPVSKKQCMEFCNLIIEDGMKIAWKSDTRADLIDDEMAEVMAKAGCFMIALGIESASEEIRETIHKNLDLNKAEETIKRLQKNGITAYVLLMVGNVGETEDTILETKKWLEKVQPDIATWVTGVMICAGTELYDISKKLGIIKDEYWLTANNDMPIFLHEHDNTGLNKLSGMLQGWERNG